MWRKSQAFLRIPIINFPLRCTVRLANGGAKINEPVTAADRIGFANQASLIVFYGCQRRSSRATSVVDIRVRATIAIGGANARLDIGTNMRRKSRDRRLRRPLNMGVDVSRCCDRPSIFLVGRSIIIYTYVRSARARVCVCTVCGVKLP